MIPIHFRKGGPLPNKGVSAKSGGSFPTGGGELGGLIRQFDWSKTSLGPLAAWPQSLKTVTDTLLGSPVPIVLLWGEDGVMIYNDAYSVFAGGRHPQLLGSKVREGWPEVADFNNHVMKVGLSGGILSYRDQELTLLRHDRPEQVWMNLDYSPVLNEAGQPAGVIAIVIETTQRVMAERTLKDRENDLASVQRIARIGGVTVDLGNDFGSGQRSLAYQEIHGLSPDAVDTHDDWVKRIHPDDRDRALNHFLTTVNGTDARYSSEYRIIRPSDGQVRWIASEAQIERDETGRPLRLIGAHMDITERTLAKELLKESEERFRLIANSAPVPMWVSKLDGTRGFANQAYLDFLGLKYEAAIVFDWRKILHSDDLMRIVNESLAGEASLKPFVLEARYRRSDGEWRWMRSESQPRWDPVGKHIGFIGVAHDVTAAKQAESELRRLNETLEQRISERTSQLESNEAQLRAIFETSNQYQAFLDLMGNVIYANKTALAGIQSVVADVAGRPFWDSPWFSATPGARAIVADGFASVMRGESVRREMLLHLPIGDRYFDFAMRPVFDQRGAITGVLPEAVDITERRQAEEALRQSQKMEAVGQLTGGVAHDFNNLLTIIRSATDFLRRRELTEDRRRRYIDAISNTVDRASKLTGQLLAFARRQPLTPEVFDVGLQVEAIAQLIRPLVGGRIQIGLEIADSECFAMADVAQFETTLINLAVNSRDAMEDEGVISIRVEKADEIPASEHQRQARGKIHCHLGRGHRCRHSARPDDGHFRAVLHHQGGRKRHRSWPEPGPRIRQAIRRRHRGRQRLEQGLEVHDLSASGETPRRSGQRRRNQPGSSLERLWSSHPGGRRQRGCRTVFNRTAAGSGLCDEAGRQCQAGAGPDRRRPWGVRSGVFRRHHARHERRGDGQDHPRAVPAFAGRADQRLQQRAGADHRSWFRTDSKTILGRSAVAHAAQGYCGTTVGSDPGKSNKTSDGKAP